MDTSIEAMNASMLSFQQASLNVSVDGKQRPVQPRRRIKEKQVIVMHTRDYPAQWRDAIDEFRRRFLLAALKKYHWNIKRTARELGVVRRTLQLHMRQMGIEKKVSKEDSE